MTFYVQHETEESLESILEQNQCHMIKQKINDKIELLLEIKHKFITIEMENREDVLFCY